MASILTLVNRGYRTSRSRLTAHRGCRSTTTSRDQMSPPSAKAPTMAVSPARAACATASTSIGTRRNLMPE